MSSNLAFSRFLASIFALVSQNIRPASRDCLTFPRKKKGDDGQAASSRCEYYGLVESVEGIWHTVVPLQGYVQEHGPSGSFSAAFNHPSRSLFRPWAVAGVEASQTTNFGSCHRGSLFQSVSLFSQYIEEKVVYVPA